MRLPGSVTFFLVILLILSAIFSGNLNLESLGDSPNSHVQGVNTQNIEDKVKDIIDGDTFTLENGEKVRLIGINAPESGQPYYNEAKLHLLNVLSSKTVKLITDTQVQDQYGRILAYVYSDQDLDVNLDMVKNGFAVSETIPPNVSREDTFLQAQMEARNNCVGIWEGLCAQNALCIQISEINPLSKDGSKNGEWIEFSNTCTSDIRLDGYLLKDNSATNSYVFGNVMLNSKKTLRLYTGCGVSSDNSLYWACPEQNNFIWNDTGDRAYLYNNDGKLVSELGY